MIEPIPAIILPGEKARARVLNDEQVVAIYEGLLGFRFSNVLIGCPVLNWACLRKITEISYQFAGDVPMFAIANFGYHSRQAFFSAMRERCSDFGEDTLVTVIRWYNPQTAAQRIKTNDGC